MQIIVKMFLFYFTYELWKRGGGEGNSHKETSLTDWRSNCMPDNIYFLYGGSVVQYHKFYE